MAGATYEERLWTPAWVVVLTFLVAGLFVAVVCQLAGLSATSTALWTAGLALVPVTIICGSTSGRRIRVSNGYLEVGFGDKVDLRWVETIEVVHGEQADAIRRAMLAPSTPSAAALPVALAGPLGLAASQLTVAWSTFRGLRARRGLVAAAWMHDGVHLHNMPAQSSDDWLIGSRTPERLADALRQAVHEAQATIVA